MARGSDTGSSEQRGPGRALRDVDQDALLEFDRLEVAPVRGERLLLIGAAFRVVDEHARHTPQIELAQILDAGVGRHLAMSPVPPLI